MPAGELMMGGRRMEKLVIGIDYGSDSARAVVVEASTGRRLGTGVWEYSRWSRGLYCDPGKNVFRQHPLDYLEALEKSVAAALSEAGEGSGMAVAALAVDTTGSTPAPVDGNGTPLALLPEFAENPDAMFYMWKDHSSIAEAAEVDRAFRTKGDVDYTKFQGAYSAEWYWAKILHARRNAPGVCERAVSWVEHSDWIPAVLTGTTDPKTIRRNPTGAGHKAYWHSEFGGLPAREVLCGLDPYLGMIADGYTKPETGGTVIGKITEEWAGKLGINPCAVVGVGVFDAHAAGLGAGIKPKFLVKVIGTSTVDMMIEQPEVLAGKKITDVCGIAENSIVPGYLGIESGQAAFGDMFSWLRRVLMWSVHDFLASPDLNLQDTNRLEKAYYDRLIGRIQDEAAGMKPDENLIALDWLNGRRYPLNNDALKGMISGLTIGTSAPQLYAALAHAAVFGSRRIFETFIAKGVEIEGVIVVGGIAKKSPYIMQMLADCLGRPIHVSSDTQASAAGAAICAAVAGGVYPSIPDAVEHMAAGYEKTYLPDPARYEWYNELYQKYLCLGRHEETFFEECLKERNEL